MADVKKVERNLGFRPDVEVSAVVSTYDADLYIEGCLEDLIQQTYYQSGKVEIIVVDCNSPGAEWELVRRYQQKHPRITYVRLSERESLASAWNIGAKYAEGQFITNANTDDRHHPECLERHAEVLRNDSAIDLVYADVYQGTKPNESYAKYHDMILYRYRPYFAPDVLFMYQFGCQPMWRASLHDAIGYFNRDLKAASDYEFNLRFALAGHRAHHIEIPLGLFLDRTDSLSREDSTSSDEQKSLRQKYVTKENILRLYGFEGWDVESDEGKIAALHHFSIRVSSYEFPWMPGKKYQDAEVALQALSAALDVNKEHPVLLNNFAATLNRMGKFDYAKEILLRMKNTDIPEPIQENIRRIETAKPEDRVLLSIYTECK